MRILVVGAGEVGAYIAERLAREGHDLVVIDTDERAIARVNELDVLGVVGDGADPSVLRENGIDHADLLLAVSGSDPVNLSACSFAMRLGASRSVARLSEVVRTSADERLAREAFGIDAVINPDEEAAREIVGLLEGRQITDSVEFDEGRVRLVGVRIDEGSALAKRYLAELRELHDDETVLVVAIIREGTTIMPRGTHRLEVGDRVYMLGTREDLEAFVTADDIKDRSGKARKVLLVGGGLVIWRVRRRK